MFSNIGWSEIGVILVVTIIVIGPERLPGLLQDIRAAVFAARKAISNAKQELNGEFDDIGAEFEQFREPLQKFGQLSRMGPRAAIAKTLFDEDDDFFNQFDPRTILKEQSQDATGAAGAGTAAARRNQRNGQHRTGEQQRPETQSQAQSAPQAQPQTRTRSHASVSDAEEHTSRARSGAQSPPSAPGGKAEFSWTDVL